jgi:hypothetical protein
MTDKQITFLGSITAGMILATSLAWSNAIQSIIIFYYPDGDSPQVISKIIFATLLTLIVVLIYKYILV